MAPKFAPIRTLLLQRPRSSNAVVLRILLLLAGPGISGTAIGETEIHKCTDADGGIVYSQLPCAPDEPVSDDSDDQDESPQSSESDIFTYDLRAAEARQPEPKSAEEVAACKKRYRDAIDVIDAEIGRDYSSDKADAYKQRLLELTRQLRRC